jgi:hypothetical protein
MVYAYKTSNNLTLLQGTSNILGFGGRTYEDWAMIRGQLLTLFGEPLYITSNFESAYQYIVIMESDQGVKFVLSVYQGKSGPSIGGDYKIEGIQDAAQELKQNVLKISPSDYEYEGAYQCGPSKIIMGVKDKKPYVLEEKISRKELQIILRGNPL